MIHLNRAVTSNVIEAAIKTFPSQIAQARKYSQLNSITKFRRTNNNTS